MKGGIREWRCEKQWDSRAIVWVANRDPDGIACDTRAEKDENATITKLAMMSEPYREILENESSCPSAEEREGTLLART